ncbi:MAG: electron transport complex subunit RsxC [bacterium]
MRNVRAFGRGGVHPHYEKHYTDGKPIEDAPPPQQVVIPMVQHTGAPCEAVVSVGDEVKVGQVIGEAKAFVSAPVHATVSGSVKAVAPRPHITGNEILSVVIESDGRDEWDESIKPDPEYLNLSPDEMRLRVRNAGLVGLGGAAFPTHVKLSPPPNKKIDTIILNGAECEPYITADHRLMLDRGPSIVEGLKLIMRITGASRGYIGIELNKPDAIRAMRDAVAGEPNISVVPLRVKYPQGAEKQLIYAILRREVPSGGLPLDVGVIVQNVGTAHAITEAIRENKPLVERVLTVTGSGVREPKNLRVRIGTLLDDLFALCGGLVNPRKVIIGGPMMGVAQYRTDVPVVKGTSAVLVLTDGEVEVFNRPANCIRCAKCVDVCPMRLVPTAIAKFVDRDEFAEAERYNALDCIECGCCSFACPAKIPLVHMIRYGKSEILARRRAAAKGN